MPQPHASLFSPHLQPKIASLFDYVSVFILDFIFDSNPSTTTILILLRLHLRFQFYFAISFFVLQIHFVFVLQIYFRNYFCLSDVFHVAASFLGAFRFCSFRSISSFVSSKRVSKMNCLECGMVLGNTSSKKRECCFCKKFGR